MGYLSRQPTSNDPPQSTDNPWGGDELMDDIALLLNGMASRCATCNRVIRNKFLQEKEDKLYCPDHIPKT